MRGLFERVISALRRRSPERAEARAAAGAGRGPVDHVVLLDGTLAAGGATLTYGERGLGLLPPGGDRLRLDGSAEFFVGLGPPRRVPHYKYVGYGGGFVSRSVAGVEAAMSEYERDPRAFGRTTAVAPSTDHLDLVGGFQDDDGPMEERPAGVVARFTYRK